MSILMGHQQVSSPPLVKPLMCTQWTLGQWRNMSTGVDLGKSKVVHVLPQFLPLPQADMEAVVQSQPVFSFCISKPSLVVTSVEVHPPQEHCPLPPISDHVTAHIHSQRQSHEVVNVDATGLQVHAKIAHAPLPFQSPKCSSG